MRSIKPVTCLHWSLCCYQKKKICISFKHHIDSVMCLPELFFRNSESAVSSLSLRWLKVVKTTDPPTGQVPVSTWWPLDIRKPQIHPQNMLMLTFSESASHDEACGLPAPAQNEKNLSFAFSITLPHTPHTSDHPAPSSHKHPQPLASGRWVWDFFSNLFNWQSCE